MAITRTGDTGVPNTDDFLVIGNTGSGTMTVSGGSDVVSEDGGVVGSQAGSNGAATITGPGSSWTTINFISVGQGGTGQLNVRSNGLIRGEGLVVGENIGASGTVDVATGARIELGHYLRLGYRGTGVLDVHDGGRLAIDDVVADAISGGIDVGGIADSGGGDGRITVRDAGSALTIRSETDQAYINLGRFGGTGRLQVLDGGQLTISAPNTFSGANIGRAGTGEMTISGAGSTASIVGFETYINLGREAGNGTLSVVDGGRLHLHSTDSFSGISVGRGGEAALGVGKMLVSAGEVLIDVEATSSGNPYMFIGRLQNGRGSLDIRDGGTVTLDGKGTTSTSVSIASDADSQGDLTVTGAGSALKLLGGSGTPGLNVGRLGNGSAVISDGGVVEVQTGTAAIGGIAIGGSAGSGFGDGVGSVTVTGAGSKLLSLGSSSIITVGEYGKGTLNVTAGGRVETLDLNIAVNAGTSGTMTVSSATVLLQGLNLDPSSVVPGAALVVGNGGTGKLTVTSSAFTVDGTTASGNLVVGRLADSVGAVTVSGSASKMRVLGGDGGIMQIGRTGDGTMTVTGGADVLVTGGLSLIARDPGSSGTVTVRDAGSLWDAGDNLYIGKQYDFAAGEPLDNGGTGTLTVRNGGQVRAGDTLLGRGTITGDGTLTTDLVNDGGTIAPGASLGTLTLRGSLTVDAGTLAIQIGGAASHDRLAVSGNADLGGRLAVSLTGGFKPAPGQSFDVLTARSIAGDFASETLPAVAGATLHAFQTILSATSQAIRIGVGDPARDGNASANTIVGTAGRDFLAGNGGNDRMLGRADADYLDGGAGNDNLLGEDGNDSLYGDAGNDLLTGGAGLDFLSGGAGSDTASYAGSAAAVTVSLLTGRGTGGDARGDVLADVENLVGSDFADRLTGSAGINRLDGGDGADTMTGGAGSDRYVVDGSGDRVIERAGDAGTDTVESTVTHTLAANVEALVLLGTGNLNGFGNASDNSITGNGGKNKLYGRGGDDTLVGGLGNDTLQGDAGTDVLRWTATSLNSGDVSARTVDTIVGGVGDHLDFAIQLDRLLEVDGTVLGRSRTDVTLTPGDSFDADTNVRFSGGTLQIDLNGDGIYTSTADFRVNLAGVSSVVYDASLDMFVLG